MDTYSNYLELARSEKEGADYEINTKQIDGAQVAIIAPHAGKIEPRTDDIAKLIAKNNFSLYCFCGRKKTKNNTLHITSSNFDEPECVKLVASHRWVVAIHGCDVKGEQVFIGGLDRGLINDLAAKLKQSGIAAETDGHNYPGKDPKNICNRGNSNEGVQFELSDEFRKNNKQVDAFVKVVRSVLCSLR